MLAVGVGASAPDGQSHPSTCVPLTARTAGPAFRRPDPPTESVSIGGQHAQTPLQTGVVDTVRSSLGSFLGPGSLPFRSECAPTALPLKRASAQLRVGGVSHRGAATANPLGAVCGEIRIDTPREWTAVHATQRKGVAGGGALNCTPVRVPIVLYWAHHLRDEAWTRMKGFGWRSLAIARLRDLGAPTTHTREDPNEPQRAHQHSNCLPFKKRKSGGAWCPVGLRPVHSVPAAGVNWKGKGRTHPSKTLVSIGHPSFY